jgi:GTP cyclohydrolase IA
MKKEAKVFYTLAEFKTDCILLKQKLPEGLKYIYGIPTGGVPVAMELARLTGIELLQDFHKSPVEKILIVDDLVDTGRTIRPFVEAGFITATLHCKAWAEIRPTICANPDSQDWIVYWWEGTEEKSIEDAVIRQLQFIGEVPTREGLRETPARVVRAWGELFAGYKQDPAAILKTFDDGACDEMVLLKNIEFYSTCEHHLLPFFGKAHIAYIPDKRVVGISKLARLLEVFSRRAQIQERLGKQITSTLDNLLKPLGSACVLEAQHFCMTSRGIQKQNSIMVTSSLSGVFRNSASARAEFMGLIQ